MRITQLTHAAMLIETSGLTIVTDPWWHGPCFGAQWWNYPRPNLDPIQDKNIDYIYVSHGHNDHYHPGTLKTFPRSATVLVSRNIDLGQYIRELGFEVAELSDDESFEINESVKVKIVPTIGGDTFLVVSDGQETCVNLNDALHPAPEDVQDRFCQDIKREFGRPDYVFCGYGVASHFPNCYRIPGKNYGKTAANRQKHFNRQWARIIAALEPRFGFPFAADVAILEDDLIWSLEPTHNAERPTDVFRTSFPQSPTHVLDIAPGFVIRDGFVERSVLREPVDMNRVRSEYAEEILRANRYGPVHSDAVDEVVELLKANAENCAPFLTSFPLDYRCLICLRNSNSGIEVAKRGDHVSIERVTVDGTSSSRYDLLYTTRLAYLRWSLTRPYAHEILFVGSGGIFEYLDRKTVKGGLHEELRVVLQRQDKLLPARTPDNSGLIDRLKGMVKAALGMKEQDLYDLDEWTVYES